WNWYLPPRVGKLLRLPPSMPAVTNGPEPAQPLPADVLAIERESTGKAVRIRLTGELDLATRHRLAAELEQVEADRPELLVIDLAGVTFMDSSGLGELVGAARRGRDAGRRVVLLRGRGTIEQMLEVAGIGGMIER